MKTKKSSHQYGIIRRAIDTFMQADVYKIINFIKYTFFFKRKNVKSNFSAEVKCTKALIRATGLNPDFNPLVSRFLLLHIV